MNGENIKAHRELRGMTQTELAVAAGVSQPALSGVETNARPCTMRMLEKLAQALAYGATTNDT